jgi:hypothetical protein
VHSFDRRENERLLAMRREDERLALEEERIRSNILDLLIRKRISTTNEYRRRSETDQS